MRHSRNDEPRGATWPSTVRAPVETVAEIAGNTALSAQSFLLDLRVRMPASLPGQFVMLGIPGDAAPLLRRPFSVLGHDPSRRSLQIHYSVEGLGTRLLSALNPGHRLSLLGPLGVPFPVPPSVSNQGLQVLVAGGRGIAPLIFLSRKASSSGRAVFLAGARSEGEMVLLDRIKATEVFLSTDDGSLGRKGTVVQLLKSLECSIGWAGSRRRAGPGAVIYGCGPAGMLRALHSFAVSVRVPCYVSLEARMACGMGVCQGCAVKLAGARFALVCKDGPVFDSKLIDWKQYEGA